MQLDHINIRAPAEAIEQARTFYCDLLGFEAGERPDFSSAGYWLYSEGRPLVHLSVGAAPGEPGRGTLDHVAFRARGLGDFLARLQQQGVDFRRAYVAELGMSQLFFSDPLGNKLELNFVGEGPA